MLLSRKVADWQKKAVGITIPLFKEGNYTQPYITNYREKSKRIYIKLLTKLKERYSLFTLYASSVFLC